MEAQALSVLQTSFELPLKNPLQSFEAQNLRAAAEKTIDDRGTPHDAAARFYSAHAENAVRNGRDLNEIKFGLVLGRLLSLKAKMRHFQEHKTALTKIGAAVQRSI
jgi:hypothetical protein